jgi:diadenosine tetraphosphate (Ap4A) HIT family hydrolase
VPIDLNDPCYCCEIVAGRVRTPGGVLWRGGGFVVYAFESPCPIPGWTMVTSERHVRGFYDLDAEELSLLLPLAARIVDAQRSALGAQHAYQMSLGEALRHFHLHVIPRYADTPSHLRGSRLFDARPEDARPAEEVEAAANAIGAALRQTDTGSGSGESTGARRREGA